MLCFFFSSRRRHTRSLRDWSSDVCSSDLAAPLDPEQACAGAHGGDVARDRVDLAVVAEHPERLRPLPRGRRVRREALMEDPERDGERRVMEVGIELAELAGPTEGLVGDR